jgi:hypothetical protein
VEGDRWPVLRSGAPLTATVPTDIPATLIAGDTWQWTKYVNDYSAADGWVLTYYLSGPGTTTTIVATTGHGRRGLRGHAGRCRRRPRRRRAPISTSPASRWLASCTRSTRAPSSSSRTSPRPRRASSSRSPSRWSRRSKRPSSLTRGRRWHGWARPLLHDRQPLRDVQGRGRGPEGPDPLQVGRVAEQHPGQLGPRRQVRFV